MIKKSDQKETEELKKIYSLYIDKRKGIKKNTNFRVEDIFGDVISKENLFKNKQKDLIIF